MTSSRRPAGRQHLSEIGRRRMERRLATGRRSDERWQHILAGAAEAFRELGYAGTTLEDVARRVGVTRASLYYYVGTKQELLIALLYRPLHQMTDNATAIVALGLPPDEALATVLRQWVLDMEETPELMLFLSENLHQVLTGREAEDVAANADEYGRLLSGIIADGVESGTFRADVDPRMAMRAILGMFSSIHLWFVPDGPKSLAEIGEEFIALVLAGLRPPG